MDTENGLVVALGWVLGEIGEEGQKKKRKKKKKEFKTSNKQT